MCKIILIIIFYIVSFSSAHSAIITKIKGYKALIDLEGVVTKEGDKFNVFNLYGKPLGEVQIKKIKKGKAIAVLLKGKMGVNWILEAIVTQKMYTVSRKTPYVQQYAERSSTPSPYSGVPNNRGSQKKHFNQNINHNLNKDSHNTDILSHRVGFLVGGFYNTISFSQYKILSGFSHLGVMFFDFAIKNYLFARVLVGYQSLVAKDDNGSSNSAIHIHYPGAGVIMRWAFLKNKNIANPWIGVGGFLFNPIGTSYTGGLDKKSFDGYHGSVVGAFGLDIDLGGVYIPIQIDLNGMNLLLISESKGDFKPFSVGGKIGLSFVF